jgi:Icc-related predicted phosphoesterase
MTENGIIRIAAVADLHCPRTPPTMLRQLFEHIEGQAEVLVLPGDVTDHGTPGEAEILAELLTTHVGMPVVAVLGNHDFENGTHEEVAAILTQAGVHVLDGDSCVAAGVGFAGIKGFGGGFGRWTLGAWGEATIKKFVQEALDEELKLETALSKLESRPQVAVLHYAPIRATLLGEPEELFPFLGCSRLEEPLRRNPVDVIVHGHAHHGSPEGRTDNDTPVYNVSMPLLENAYPNRPPVCIIELEREGARFRD